MAQPPRRRSLEDIFGQSAGATTASATRTARPSLDQIFSAPKEEEPSFLSKAGAIARGVLDAPGQVFAQTAARLAGIGESEETKRKYQSYVDKASAMAGPSGKTRPAYETSRAIASLPVEIAKYAAVTAIPGVGLPAAAALGAGESAGGLKEESSAALAQMLAEKANAPRTAQALAAINETGLGRATFDVALGKALEMGVRGATKGVKAVKAARAGRTAPVVSEGQIPATVETAQVVTPKQLTTGTFQMPASTASPAWNAARSEELLRRTRETSRLINEVAATAPRRARPAARPAAPSVEPVAPPTVSAQAIGDIQEGLRVEPFAKGSWRVVTDDGLRLRAFGTEADARAYAASPEAIDDWATSVRMAAKPEPVPTATPKTQRKATPEAPPVTPVAEPVVAAPIEPVAASAVTPTLKRIGKPNPLSPVMYEIDDPSMKGWKLYRITGSGEGASANNGWWMESPSGFFSGRGPSNIHLTYKDKNEAIEKALERVRTYRETGTARVGGEAYAVAKEEVGAFAAAPLTEAPTTSATPKTSRRRIAAQKPVTPPTPVRPEQQSAAVIGGETIPVRYRVVDAQTLQPSHNPFTFQQNPNYPKEIQGRNYHTDRGAQNEVATKSLDLNAQHLLDQTSFSQSGAPIITPSGVVVTGNQRTMMVKRAIEQAPQKYATYVEQLKASAGRYGLTPDDFAGVQFPVLVREMDDLPTAQLGKLNRLSDIPETKAKSGLDDAASRFAVLRQPESSALKQLTNTLGEDETLAQYLETGNGRQFVKNLVQDGAIQSQEASRYLQNVDAGVLTDDGKRLVQRMVTMAALEDPEIISRAPASTLLKVEGALPHIVRSDFEGDATFKIGATVKEAIALLTEAKEKGIKLADLLQQTSMFGGSAISPAVERMAMFLNSAKKSEVTDAFRRYGNAANEARLRETSGAFGDMFGDTIKGADELQSTLFRPKAGGVEGQQLSAVAGGLAGGLTGEENEDPEVLFARMLLGASAAAGVGYAGKRYMASRRPAPPPSPRGSTPAIQAINETINVGARNTPEADRLLTKWERFKTQMVSETFPLLKAAEMGGGKAARMGVEEAIGQQHGIGQATKQYLTDRLAAPLSALDDAEVEDLRGLLKARRALDIAQNYGGIKMQGNPALWRQAIIDAERNPKVKAAADAVNKLHLALLEQRLEAGLLTPEAFEAIKNSESFYTPFLREIADDVNAGTTLLSGSRSGRFNVFSSGVKRMDRTAEALANTADPLEMAVAATQRTMRDVAKQRVSNQIFALADDGSIPFIEQVQIDPTKPLPRGVVQQLREGKLRAYKVSDPDLYAAIATQDVVSQNLFVKLLQGMKEIKTMGITLLPDFAVGNVGRDVTASGIQRSDLLKRGFRESGLGAGIVGVLGGAYGATSDDSDGVITNFLRGAGMGAGVGMYARPLKESLAAMRSIIKNDDVYQNFLRLGGSTEGFYVKTPKDAQQVVEALRKSGVSQRDILSPRSWLDALRFVGSVGEQSTRIAAYKQAMDAGMSPQQAILEAQDRTLRFSNVGSLGKKVASVTPFWNAKVQGWDKLFRMLKQPKTWGAAGAALTAPTLALWSVNKDNPEYWERPLWERNLFWLVPKGEGGGFWRVPKPFEIGYIFASLPERMADYAAQSGTLGDLAGISTAAPVSATPEDAVKRAAFDMASSTFEGTLPVPQFMSLPMQIAADKDFFRNRAIVSRPDLPTEMQARTESSAVARALAQYGISPEKTDFVLRDIGGTAGSEALRAIDRVAYSAGANIPKPEGGIPFLDRFRQRFTTQERGQTESELAARNRLRELGMVEAGLREVKKTNDKAEIRAYMENNYDALVQMERLKPLQTRLDKLTALKRKAENDKRLTPDQRQQMLQVLRDRANTVSRAIVQIP